MVATCPQGVRNSLLLEPDKYQRFDSSHTHRTWGFPPPFCKPSDDVYYEHQGCDCYSPTSFTLNTIL